MEEKVIAYIALGSNLGDRIKNLRTALDSLSSSAGVYEAYKSPVYESPAAEVPDQPDFLNRVVEVETWIGPHELLARCQEVEKKMRRKKTREKGPRVIDVDILLFGDAVLNDKDLVIPHPALTERAFFLVPLMDLAGNIFIPGTGLRISDALAELAPYKLEKVNERGW
ncbi:MAG: 2-amino-4-hydroxy-6-hydroxymethyldihydropteridine diphosphokinase [Candidatus Coatesbacteria bacterium]|nr:MAG: 2-amino-4-hydroxy-6-hydroxymethyldihydropteridine diphosphokinase [Candidatus Coatesbacteria bacterium]